MRYNASHLLSKDDVMSRFIAYALKFSVKDRKAVLWYVVRRLSEPFIWFGYTGRKYTFMIDEKREEKINQLLNQRLY